MKKRFLLVCVALFCLLCLALTLPVAAESELSTTIKGHNLKLDSVISIMYYVDFQNAPEGAEKGVLVWEAPQDSYVYGTESAKLGSTETDHGYDVFYYPGISSKMMTQDVYAMSYIKNGEEITYSSLDKYSVLQYAHNKAGDPTVLPGGTVTLGELLTDLLNYGATAQKFFNYNTDRLANATYYQITVEGGTLPDGTTKGLFQEGESVTLTATTPNFDHWENATGEMIESTFTVTGTKTYTAIWYSKGLKFTSNGDGTCYVSGRGTCTDYDIVIPPTSPEGDSVTEIGGRAFESHITLTSVTIPNGVTRIGQRAFYSCSSMTSATIPDSVTSIEESAFSQCRSLTSVTLGNGLTNIGTAAFAACYSLTGITIPESVTSIGEYAFRGCYALTSLSIPANVTDIGVYAFKWCRRLELNVAKDNHTFHDDGNCLIETATGTLIAGFDNSAIPSDGSVTSIGKGAFDCCIHIESLEIPASVTSIGESAFSDCDGILSLTFAANSQLTTIERQAFDSCDAITSVVFPSSLTNIGMQAFSGCTSLTSIEIPDSVTSIGYSAFSDCPIEVAIIPAIAGRFIRNSNLKTVVITAGTTIEWSSFTGCTSLTSIEIPYSVTSIEKNAFVDCTSLTSIEIPESVTSIGQMAFYSCTSLTSITIPDSVTSIGYDAFRDCSSLTSVTIGNGITSIGKSVFSNCPIETAIIPAIACKLINNSNLETVVIIDGTSIENKAFQYCSSLTSIEIPDSVTSIGQYAFYSCTSLTSITYTGAEEEWNAISKGSGWDSCTSAYTIYCTDGDIEKQ